MKKPKSRTAMPAVNRDRLHSIPSAAQYLGGLSLWTVRAWISSGRVQHVKVGRRTMVRESELLRMIVDGGKASRSRRALQVEKRTAGFAGSPLLSTPEETTTRDSHATGGREDMVTVTRLVKIPSATQGSTLIEVRRAWPGGPLLRISPTPRPGFTLDDQGAYRGHYLCDFCGRVAGKGVYEPKPGHQVQMWLCGELLEVGSGPLRADLGKLQSFYLRTG